MITRRAFLKGSAGATAGLILPSWLVKAENYIDIEAKPYLEPPARKGVTIYAIDWGDAEYQLSLGDPYADVPDITWREMLNWQGFESFEEYYETDDPQSLPEYSLDDLVPDTWMTDYWVMELSPDARAYRFLEGYDLGFDFRGEDAVGEINFIEGPAPGNNSRIVTVPDDISLSLLQKRLNELDGTVKVALYTPK
jgi:hypothetical protein